MLVTVLLSFIAGLLTALAPCVLPLLPIILGGSLDTNDSDKRRPYIITASLVTSLILFTILLKVSTVFIGVDPRVWTIGAGLLVVTLGVFMLFPNLWAVLMVKFGIEHRSQKLLSNAYGNKNKTTSAILTGAALGPVFSSCSPTYAWVIATVLPRDTLSGIFYLAIYCLGVAVSLLAISLLGRKLLDKIKWASNPNGLFQKSLAVLFILVGIFVATGWDKNIQTYLVDKDFFKLIQLEQKLVPENNKKSVVPVNSNNKEKYNINSYQAPDFKEIDTWLNSSPLTIDKLKGRVVLIDFWTYSCINCQRTQPYLNDWYSKYKDAGLEIIGVHAPEFAFEKITQNVERATNQANIKYPVALDNNFSTWNNYNNRFWPAKYLIDKDGQVRYTHFGEGQYDETEKIIQKLLKESGKNINNQLTSKGDNLITSKNQSPETYFGYERAERFANANQFTANKTIDYKLVNNLQNNYWSIGGSWNVGKENSKSIVDGSTMLFNFNAQEVYVVVNGPQGSVVNVSLDGISNPGGADLNAQNQLVIDGARLYKIVKNKTFLQNKQLKLVFPANVTISAITFGG